MIIIVKKNQKQEKISTVRINAHVSREIYIFICICSGRCCRVGNYYCSIGCCLLCIFYRNLNYKYIHMYMSWSCVCTCWSGFKVDWIVDLFVYVMCIVIFVKPQGVGDFSIFPYSTFASFLDFSSSFFSTLSVYSSF